MICVVIPAFNEEGSIAGVVAGAARYAPVVVVDDGSTDRTAEMASLDGVRVLRHCTNLGKGAALRTGCDYAFSVGASAVIVMDSDGQHDPRDVPRFIDALGGVDLVYGSRLIDEGMPGVFRFGNGVINFVTRVLYGARLFDTQSGFRAFTKRAYGVVRWDSSRYSVESEIIVRASRAGLKHRTIFIRNVYARDKGTTPLDGLKIVMDLILWRFIK